MAGFIIRQCADGACDFRWPVEAGDATAGAATTDAICPRCGGPAPAAIGPHDGHPVERPFLPAALPPLAGLLDSLRSIHNVGSIFRSADGAGLAHLSLCGITPTPAHPRLAKTALGAETAVSWSYHPNCLPAARALQAGGWQLWAIEGGPRAEPLFSRPRTVADGPVVLVVGNEKAGVDPALLALCDRVLALPMAGGKRSLNAAVAFGIAAYQLQYAAAAVGERR